MDYKYINQLLERYWRCETSVEEESILRAFFRQEVIPAELKRYKSLFAYAGQETEQNVLGNDFDRKLLTSIEKTEPVKARIITMPQRLKPLFKAAAVVAIVLTLGNAVQVSFTRQQKDPISSYDGYYKPELQKGTSVAMDDSAKVDTIQQSMAMPTKKAQ
ncbi:MAG: pyruvate ferredoxin oxidoreductase [Prevotella sp.]